MDKYAGAHLALLFGLMLGDPFAAAGENLTEPVCRAEDRASAPIPAPRSVLLVPLLKGFEDESGSETWPNHPVAQLADFYRRRFHARTTRLLGVRTWNGFLEKAGRLWERGESFDRIILIGHGGLDGPILDEDMIVRERSEDGAEGRAVRTLEYQPGLVDTLTIRYDAAHNPAFAAALAQRWDELAGAEPGEVARTLRQLESRLEPPDAACVAHHCPPALLDAIPGEARREDKRRLCEWVCRHPLYELHQEERADPARFARYADSLSALARPGALIIIGSCNPGTGLPKTGDLRDTGGLLPGSALAGGPHGTYLHLLASATGRFAAGPVGQASASDIVARIQRYETGDPPRDFLLVAPPVRCADGP